jgi:hypothetical protein
MRGLKNFPIVHEESIAATMVDVTVLEHEYANEMAARSLFSHDDRAGKEGSAR